MLLPPPDRRRHFPEEYQRRDRPERDEQRSWSEPVSFQERGPTVEQERSWEQTKALLRERLEIERDLVSAEVAREEARYDEDEPQEFARHYVESNAQARSAEPRRVVAEETNGSETKRWYSDGSVLVRSADGSIRTEAGVEIRSAGESEIRVYSGAGANVLRGEN